jgi:type VI secretion system secreted protein Hcp
MKSLNGRWIMSTKGIAKSAVIFVFGAVAVLAIALYSPAGPLDPTAPPAGTMHTLGEIYANTASVVVPPEILARPRGKAYLRIANPEVKGESQDSLHKDWIDIFGNSFQESNVVVLGGGGGAGAGKVSFSDITVVKEMDSSSPKFMLTCARGDRYGEVLIQGMMPGANSDKKCYEIKMTHAFVTGVAPRMVYRGDSFVIMEEVKFRFARIDWTYYPYDESGRQTPPVTAYWEIDTNTGG